MQHIETEMLNHERRERASKELYFGGLFNLIHHIDTCKSKFRAKYLGHIVQGTKITLQFLVDDSQVLIDFDHLHNYSILQIQ